MQIRYLYINNTYMLHMVAIVFMVAGMSSRFGGNPKQMAKKVQIMKH